MTCIVGLEHKGSVYIGGDSAAVAGWTIKPVTEPKVFRNGNVLIGYTSSFRMGQILQYDLHLLPDEENQDDQRYLVTKFIPSVRECLKNGGYTKIDNNQESGGWFLVGYHGKLFKVCADFQITRTSLGFDAVGAGEDFALGALARMKITNPKDAITKALEISAFLCGAVRPPYYVEKL